MIVDNLSKRLNIIQSAQPKKNKTSLKRKQNIVVYDKMGKEKGLKFIRYRESANKRGIKFNLSIKDFISFWRKPCHYCNRAIETIGIDRIDSDKGYIVDNCVPCCSTCNWIKMDKTIEQMREDVILLYNNKDNW